MGIVDGQLIATMRDRAAVNGVAIRTLKVLYPSLIDIGCFSHTLDNVGDRFSIPILDQFFKVWIGMFSRSPKTKLAWKTKTGLPVPTYSATRWWSKWEVLRDLHNSFGDVHSFLQDSDLPPSRLKLLEILDHDPDKRKLCMELAVVVDAGEPIVKATYRLEGDGPLALTAYEEISTLRNTISIQHYPNVDAVAKNLSMTPTQVSQLTNYAKGCVKPAQDYFRLKFDVDLKEPLSIFKLIRIFHPSKAAELKPTLTDIDDLARALPFVTKQDTINLKNELPLYLAKVEDVQWMWMF